MTPDQLPPEAATAEGLERMIDQLTGALHQIAAHPDAPPEKRAAAQHGLDAFAGITAQLQDSVEAQFTHALTRMMQRCYSNAHAKGFWSQDHQPGDPGGRNDGEACSLLHSEVSELLEALREETMPESKKIPGFSLAEEEAADLLIRLCEYSCGRGWRLPAAVLAKYKYNLSRPPKHGRNF